MVLKQGKTEGSPWPKGMTGLVSFWLRLASKVLRRARTVKVAAVSMLVLQYLFSPKRHLVDAPFSMFCSIE